MLAWVSEAALQKLDLPDNLSLQNAILRWAAYRGFITLIDPKDEKEMEWDIDLLDRELSEDQLKSIDEIVDELNYAA